MAITINSLEIENLKRIKAVKIEPSATGLTVVGGKNNQGKTSVLDSIAWALGGDRYKPSDPQRKGSVIPPNLHVKLSNGLIVERKGKNSALTVTDPEGKKHGQQLLNEFTNQLALDLPKFMEASSKEKAQTLLKIIGVGDKLRELEDEENSLYNQRLVLGRMADQKAKFALEMAEYPNVPTELISVTELLMQQQEILARNGENQRLRSKAAELEEKRQRVHRQLEELNAQYNILCEECEIAQRSAADLQDESTAELEANIADIEAINVKVRANLDKEKAQEEARQYKYQYDQMSRRLEILRENKMSLLKNADLPLPGLSVDNGELTYNGFKWDNMSGSQQLKVSAAIVRRLNPDCGFVLIDKLEQMDIDSLNEFGAWLQAEGLQAIATRVSTGSECSIIIEDGYVSGQETTAAPPEEYTPKTWKAGEF